MKKSKDKTPDKERSAELFISLVGAVGTRMGGVSQCISEILQEFDYGLEVIRYSEFFKEDYFKSRHNLRLHEEPPYRKIYSQMEAGNKVREKSKKTGVGILSIYAARKVKKARQRMKKNNRGNAYLFWSLKHPEESKTLKDTYGPGYYQIGIYTPQEQRTHALMSQGMSRADASKLIDKDIAEEKKEGQQTRNTFYLSDFFVKDDHNDPCGTERELTRIFDLIFGDPHITPTIDEHMMFMAHSYSSRSADLSRQVGAVVVNRSRDIIGIGSNDVPHPGGGPYWPEFDSDHRDHLEGHDPNEKMKNKAIIDIIKKMKDKTISDIMRKIKNKNSINIIKEIKNNKEDDSKLLEQGKKILKDNIILDITEFNRATHAEMSAILSCARNGTSPLNATLYSTTFPCHNCAKHIVDVGIKKVFFIEPYPKSQALDLHGDSITFLSENPEETKYKVTFDHFMGVSSRRYLDLFSLKLGTGIEKKRKEKKTGDKIEFIRKDAIVRVPVPTISGLTP